MRLPRPGDAAERAVRRRPRCCCCCRCCRGRGRRRREGTGAQRRGGEGGAGAAGGSRGALLLLLLLLRGEGSPSRRPGDGARRRPGSGVRAGRGHCGVSVSVCLCEGAAAGVCQHWGWVSTLQCVSARGGECASVSVCVSTGVRACASALGAVGVCECTAACVCQHGGG